MQSGHFRGVTLTMDEAEGRIRTALQAVGFGVLTEIAAVNAQLLFDLVNDPEMDLLAGEISTLLKEALNAV